MVTVELKEVRCLFSLLYASSQTNKQSQFHEVTSSSTLKKGSKASTSTTTTCKNDTLSIRSWTTLTKRIDLDKSKSIKSHSHFTAKSDSFRSASHLKWNSNGKVLYRCGPQQILSKSVNFCGKAEVDAANTSPQKML